MSKGRIKTRSITRKLSPFWHVCLKIAITQSFSFVSAVREVFCSFLNVPEMRRKQRKCLNLLLKRKDVIGFHSFGKIPHLLTFWNKVLTGQTLIMWNVTLKWNVCEQQVLPLLFLADLFWYRQNFDWESLIFAALSLILLKWLMPVVVLEQRVITFFNKPVGTQRSCTYHSFHETKFSWFSPFKTLREIQVPRKKRCHEN